MRWPMKLSWKQLESKYINKMFKAELNVIEFENLQVNQSLVDGYGSEFYYFIKKHLCIYSSLT